MPGFYIARRTVNENGNTFTVDYSFDTMEAAVRFVSGVRNVSSPDKGHEFEILSHESEEMIKRFPPRDQGV